MTTGASMTDSPEQRHDRAEQRLVLALLAPALAVVTALLILPLIWLHGSRSATATASPWRITRGF